MNSPFANIFLALQQQIRSAVSGITYVDQDLGQLRTGTRPPVAWPCVLIDLEDFSFGNMSTNVQTAQGTVVLRLGFAPYSATSGATPSSYAQQALAYYDLEWSLHKAVQGWSPGDDYGSLIRTNAATQKRTDSYRVRELRYSIAFEDYSTRPSQQYSPATLVVDDQIGL
jgi:hypothetical protein